VVRTPAKITPYVFCRFVCFHLSLKCFLIALAFLFLAQKRNDTDWMKHTVSWDRNGKIELDFRPVHMGTLDEKEMHHIPPKARVY
jgi:hypothetical protein